MRSVWSKSPPRIDDESDDQAETEETSGRRFKCLRHRQLCCVPFETLAPSVPPHRSTRDSPRATKVPDQHGARRAPRLAHTERKNFRVTSDQPKHVKYRKRRALSERSTTPTRKKREHSSDVWLTKQGGIRTRRV